MKKVLLHICCPNCATVCIERLRKEGFCVYGYFYNPNIHPHSEYEKRKADLDVIRHEYDIEIIEGCCNPLVWWEEIKGYEQEPEGGSRCSLCFGLRLRYTYNYMLSRNMDFFTTTLTISPHKNSRLVNETGSNISRDKFLIRDFKKSGGFQDSLKLSRQFNFYRQDYCGCIPSKNEKRYPQD
ncbi:MAG: recombinase [Candidatus Omnitrophica bacterium]|nr:recombinase [Candidatus Omnitrophota bacterium]MBD3268552.1 recombinase [Candidatus Omnitrophota bacterium]